jgi:DNA-binding SARP family transcriptional activator
MLELRTLGSIELRDDAGRSIDNVVRHPKRIALLAYLCASHPPHSYRRETLLGLFWPDQDEAHARASLRQELHHLRRGLGPDVVRGDRADALWIDGDRLWCDAREFEAALCEGCRPEALALWQGEFLPGLHVDGGEFERWLDAARDRLTQEAVVAARQLVREAQDAGDDATALRWARRLTELAPYDETGWYELILLLDRQGDRAGALRAYDALAARLRRELDVEPSPETRRLAQGIRGREEAYPSEGTGASNATRSPAMQEARAHSRARIELRPVENLTGERTLDVLSRRVTDRLTQGLVDAMFVDVAPPGSGAAITAVLSATLYRRGESLEVVPRIAEPGEAGRVVEMPRTVALSPDAPDDQLDLLTAHVLASLAAHYDPRFDAAATRERALPIPTPLWEAYLEFLKGSELFGRLSFAEGYRHLLRAHEIDPDFVKAGFFAAIALAWSGQPEAAEALVRRAMAVGRRLTDYERLGCEWLIAVLHGRRTEAYRAAIESIPVSSHPVVWYLAAREALFMNRPREALRLMQGVDFWQGWWRTWTEYFEILGGAHHVLGNHRAELALAHEGRERFPGSLEPIRAEVRARAALGDTGWVSRLVDEALTLSSVLTSPADVAWVAAQELDVHGEAGSAAAIRGVALEWLAGLPTPSLTERQLRVRLLLECGNAEGAARALAQLVPFDHPESLGLRGLVAAREGDVIGASGVLSTLEGLENPYLGGRHLLLATGIRAALGAPDAAVSLLRRAFAAGLPFGVELHALPALQPIAGRADFRALLRPRG